MVIVDNAYVSYSRFYTGWDLEFAFDIDANNVQSDSMLVGGKELESDSYLTNTQINRHANSSWNWAFTSTSEHTNGHVTHRRGWGLLIHSLGGDEAGWIFTAPTYKTNLYQKTDWKRLDVYYRVYIGPTLVENI